MTKRLSMICSCAVFALATANPVQAQTIPYGSGSYDSDSNDSDSGAAYEGTSRRAGPRTEVRPYIEASQIVSAELSPGDDTVTYTQLAGGVDASVNGRNNGGSVSLRYEYNVGYGDAVDSSSLSGVARGYASIVPQTVTIEAGGLAAKTRVDGNGAATLNPLLNEDSSSTIYSGYVGPNVNTRLGDAQVNANYRIGYTRVESPDLLVAGPDAQPVDVFDDSLSQSANVHVGTQPGQPLPVGLGIGAGWRQEDVSNLDQRYTDLHVRGDVTVPVSRSVAFVGGIGYEDVEVSSRDAVRDQAGNPVIDDNGRFVTDKSQPRELAYDVSGLIWDVGVVWRPSSRTSAEAHIGRRYDSTTYYGSFAWAPNSRSSLNLSVYDNVSGFGGQLTNALANLPTEFTATRNALTGDLDGCVAGANGGGNCLNGTLASVRSSVFRSRGVNLAYSTNIGRLRTGVGVGYDRRKYIAGENTVLADANGVTDEAFYSSVYLAGDVGRKGSFQTNAYATLLDSGFENSGDVLTLGGSAAYSHNLSSRLAVRAAVALDHIDNELAEEDVTVASGLLGLRYGF